MKRTLAMLTTAVVAFGAIACSGGSDDIVPAALADEPATLAYVTVSGTETTLWMREPDGESRAVSTYPGEVLYSLLGSPDGRYIAANAGHMVILDRDGYKLLRLREASTFYAGAIPLASWSPDASRLAYMYADEGSSSPLEAGVEIVEVPSGTVITPDEIAEFRIAMPSFSPDGQRLAAIERFNTMEASVVIIESSGERTVLDADSAERSVWFPSWSPDGQWIVYGVQDLTVPEDVFTAGVLAIPVSGSEPKLLAFAGFPSHEGWSRDGKTVALSCIPEWQVEIGEICVVELGDRTVTTLTDDGENFAPAMSPDGNIIAYLHGVVRDPQDPVTFTLKVLDLRSGEVTEIATGVPLAGFTWLANPGEA